jgi:DHA3 family macrolide efflux protein-like MFS transporter
MVLSAPMILARSGNKATVLGTVQSVAGAGDVLGGILLSPWDGLKHRIVGVIAGLPSGQQLKLCCRRLYWQAKVPPEIQGKVFSARLLIAQIASPLSMLAAGPIADYIFIPAMMQGGG